MCVDNFDVWVIVQQIRHISPVLRIMQRIKTRADKDSPTHSTDLVVLFPGDRFVCEKIELELAPVNLTVVVHQHGFDTSARHITDGMQHSKHCFESSLVRSQVRRRIADIRAEISRKTLFTFSSLTADFQIAVLFFFNANA